MACGAPVLSSNIEPMPEICQDAAVYFDPFKPQNIAEKMIHVLTDEDLLKDMKRRSLKERTGLAGRILQKKHCKSLKAVIVNTTNNKSQIFVPY